MLSVSSVFDQFSGGGQGAIGFNPAIEDFSGATAPRGRLAKAGKAGGDTGGELQSRGGGGVGDLAALGAALPSLGQVAPRINVDLIEQVTALSQPTHTARMPHFLALSRALT